MSNDLHLEIQYSDTLLQKLTSFWKADYLTDAILEADSKTTRVHKVILAAASEHLHNVFQNTCMSESNDENDVIVCMSDDEQRYIFQNIDFETLQQIVGFCYTGLAESQTEAFDDVVRRLGLGSNEIFLSEVESDGGNLKEIKSSKTRQYCKCLLKRLNDFMKDNHYTDAKIKVGSNVVTVHKIVLSAVSEYFRALFEMDKGFLDTDSEIQPSSLEVFEVYEVDFETLLQLIEFAYSGSLHFNTDNVQQMFVISDYLAFDLVRDECENFILDNISPLNCIEIFEFADDRCLNKWKDFSLGYIENNITIENCVDVINFGLKIGNTNLKMKALTFLYRKFEYIKESERFPKLHFDLLLEIFKKDDIFLFQNGIPVSGETREEWIISAGLRYLNLSEFKSDDHIQLILEAVRLPLVSEHFLKHEISRWPRLKVNTVVTKMFEKARLAKSRASSDSDELPSDWMKHRLLSKRKVIFDSNMFHGTQTGETISEFDDYKLVKEDNRIVNVKIWTSSVESSAIIGIALTYTNKAKIQHGGCQGDVHDVEFQENEAIIKVTCTFSSCMNSIMFQSNLGNVYGPFGKPKGRDLIAVLPVFNSVGFLHSFKGSVVDMADYWVKTGIKSLGFTWISYSKLNSPGAVKSTKSNFRGNDDCKAS